MVIMMVVMIVVCGTLMSERHDSESQDGFDDRMSDG